MKDLKRHKRKERLSNLSQKDIDFSSKSTSVSLTKVVRFSRPPFISRFRNKREQVDLSSKEDRLILKSARIASSKAVRSSTALGLTIKVIKNNKLIEIYPDQTEKVLRTISKSKLNTSSFKKGMILERK